jgi:hypothetical protein
MTTYSGWCKVFIPENDLSLASLLVLDLHQTYLLDDPPSFSEESSPTSRLASYRRL